MTKVGRKEKDVLHGGPIVSMPELIHSEAIVNMPVDGPMRLLFISDLHIFDPDSNKDYIKEVFDELAKPNTYAVLLGDIIQGFNLTHPEMASGTPRLDEQMLSMETALKPYADKGKLIASVSGNHEGWGDKGMTLDVNYFMLRNLKGADGGELPKMNNGGLLRLKFPNGSEHRILLYHNAGAGGSPKNMVGAQRARAMEIMIDDPNCPDQVVAGDKHSRAMITTELVINTVTGEVMEQSFASGGTAQGIDPKRPNAFLANMGAAPSLRGLPATILIPEADGGVGRRDVWGLESSGELLKAVRLWDVIESRSMGAELEGMIREKMAAGKAVFREDLSRQVERAEDKVEIQSRAYDLARWDISSGVPVAVYFVGGLSYGASTTDEIGAMEVMREVEDNPEAYVINTRGMVDIGLSARMDREFYLDKSVNLIKPAGLKNKDLALLVDVRLREAKWKGELGDPESEDGYSPAIITGDYFQENIPGLPLIANNASVMVDVNGALYRIWVRDKVGQNGSTENPFGGLEAQKRKNRTRIDVAVGGHMPKVGVSQSDGGVVVAPGAFSKWKEQGEGNEENVPKGGQAVFFYSGTRRIMAAATFAKARDTHRALFYYEGLKFLPTDVQAKMLRMRRRRN